MPGSWWLLRVIIIMIDGPSVVRIWSMRCGAVGTATHQVEGKRTQAARISLYWYSSNSNIGVRLFPIIVLYIVARIDSCTWIGLTKSESFGFKLGRKAVQNLFFQQNINKVARRLVNTWYSLQGRVFLKEWAVKSTETTLDLKLVKLDLAGSRHCQGDHIWYIIASGSTGRHLRGDLP